MEVSNVEPKSLVIRKNLSNKYFKALIVLYLQPNQSRYDGTYRYKI